MSIVLITRLFISISLVSFLSFTGTAAAEQLGGETFSDPSVEQEMPPEWRDKPITYDKADGKADLVITLNQQFYEYMLPYVNKFADEQGLRIIAKRGTCGVSAGMLSKKQGDIGGFCCPPGKTDRLPGLRFHTVGIHPISFLVHPDNPVENISSEDLRKVFQGKIVQWSELGWDNGIIQPVVRLHCKKRPGHWRSLLDNEDLFGPEVRAVGAIEDMFSMIADTPAAIGYEVMWLSNREAGKVKSLSIDGRDPADLETLVDGSYPFYRVLYLTTWEDERTRNPHSRKLVDYIIKQAELHGMSQGIIPVSRLKKAGWKFIGNELVWEPE
jgi:hypothetical protein